MTLSKLEQETIIVFNESESTAVVSVCNVALKNKLDKLCSDYEITRSVKDEYCTEYIVPKKWVKVSPPRVISEENKEKLRMRMLEMNSKKT